MKNGKEIKSKYWAVLYKSSLGLDGIAFRCVVDNGEKVLYPRIFMAKKEAKKYGRNRSDYRNFRVVPVEVNYKQ